MFSFHLAEKGKADKNSATFKEKTVDKTQFDKCRNIPNCKQKKETQKTAEKTSRNFVALNFVNDKQKKVSKNEI